MEQFLRVNIGCGMSPTEGWLNFDNSLSLRVSKYPSVYKFLRTVGLVSEEQYRFIEYCRENKICWADATKKIPLQNDSVEVIYSLHMLEHLDKDQARMFLQEAKRVLKVGGVIRLVLPDLEKNILSYIEKKDADEFISSTLLCVETPKSFKGRLQNLLIGNRHHLWMYDGASLVKLLNESGFGNAKVLEPGETTIAKSGSLDLHERKEESVFVEANKL